MKKHYYKKYYDNHREQEKKRTNAYYHEHRDEILARRKAKRDTEPKVYKPTLREKLAITENALRMKIKQDRVGCPDWLIDDEFNFWLGQAKEMLKDE